MFFSNLFILTNIYKVENLTQQKFNAVEKMKLQEYMKMRKMTPTKLAKFLDVSYMTLWNWLTGKRRPNLDKAIEIELLTKRVVRCIDWKNDPVVAKRAHMKVDTSLVKKRKRKTKDKGKIDEVKES